MSEFGHVTPGQLKSFIERIERLEEEKTGIAQDIKEVYLEAKAHGYDTKIIRQVVKIRKMDREELAEQEELVQLYCHALGMAPEAITESSEESPITAEAA